jgi:hypothetical protein
MTACLVGGELVVLGIQHRFDRHRLEQRVPEATKQPRHSAAQSTAHGLCEPKQKRRSHRPIPNRRWGLIGAWSSVTSVAQRPQAGSARRRPTPAAPCPSARTTEEHSCRQPVRSATCTRLARAIDGTMTGGSSCAAEQRDRWRGRAMPFWQALRERVRQGAMRNGANESVGRGRSQL